uniref:Transmembrane protein n=1 Tax=Haemonchus contortus TaxID=6289 RepID=A0A7I4Z5M5_HAECO
MYVCTEETTSVLPLPVTSSKNIIFFSFFSFFYHHFMYVCMYGMVWYGIVGCGMVGYGMVWYGKVWYGMVCMYVLSFLSSLFEVIFENYCSSFLLRLSDH